jgi:hypothetical protein
MYNFDEEYLGECPVLRLGMKKEINIMDLMKVCCKGVRWMILAKDYVMVVSGIRGTEPSGKHEIAHYPSSAISPFAMVFIST